MQALNSLQKLKGIENKSKEEVEIIKDQIKKQNHLNILEIRQVIQSYGDVGKIYLGGIPMIADDMMTFIKSDIIVFGLGVLLFIIATLWFVFRNLLWIVVPISSCLFSVIIMMGLLGLLGWKVTVISSNFIALMLILTMAMNIHMSTRFLQLKKDFPSKNNFEIISLTTSKMFWPILYTVLTTIFAFLSLIFSEIKPIIDFGWMMTFGLITSFIITFTLLPTLLNFAPTNNISVKKEQKSKITNLLSLISINNKNSIFLVTGIVIIFSVIGISKLEVENSFINYFDKNTEIYKGMKLIDEELGGTTPLEVIIKFPEKEKVKKSKEDDEFEVSSRAAKLSWATRRYLNPEKWGEPTEEDLNLLYEKNTRLGKSSEIDTIVCSCVKPEDLEQTFFKEQRWHQIRISDKMKNKIKAKEYQKNLRKNPDHQKKRKQYMKTYVERLRNDPEKLAIYLEKKRERQKNKKELLVDDK